MSDDRELLEKAARAAGMAELTQWSEAITDHDSPHWGGSALHAGGFGGECQSWNPLTDDGDALRLAVKLGLIVHANTNSASSDGVSFMAQAGERDPFAATRRAIVRAAAALSPAAPADAVGEE